VLVLAAAVAAQAISAAKETLPGLAASCMGVSAACAPDRLPDGKDLDRMLSEVRMADDGGFPRL
jgi:hypothetical protein